MVLTCSSAALLKLTKAFKVSLKDFFSEGFD